MQQPLLRATPNPNQEVNRDGPNVVRHRGGWYPRWWIISAFFCSTLIIFTILFGRFLPCFTTNAYLCHVDTWYPVLQVLLIWSIFIIFWWLALLFGLGPIEVPGRERSQIARFFRSVSEFGPLHLLLMIYGSVALCGLAAMWLLDRTTPLAFAVASIVVFVANCSLFQQSTGRERRRYLIGYGVLALIALVLTLLYRLQSEAETPFILAELLFIGIGIRAIFWRPRPARQLTAQEELDENIAQAASPLYILRSAWPFNRFFPNRPGN